MFDMFSTTCPGCGAAVNDVGLHAEWHAAMDEVIRMVAAPEMSPEEWKAFVTQRQIERAAEREAERTVRQEDRRLRAEKISEEIRARREQ